MVVVVTVVVPLLPELEPAPLVVVPVMYVVENVTVVVELKLEAPEPAAASGVAVVVPGTSPGQ